MKLHHHHQFNVHVLARLIISSNNFQFSTKVTRRVGYLANGER